MIVRYYNKKTMVYNVLKYRLLPVLKTLLWFSIIYITIVLYTVQGEITKNY